MSLRLLLLALVLFPASLPAQEFSSVGNQYVTAYVANSVGSYYGGGRFYIDAGPFHGGYKFLYYVTSNVIFRIQNANGTNYYTNAKAVFGGQPLEDDGVTPVPYAAFDSIYISKDTIAVTWKKLDGFTVTMRVFAEPVTSQYARGSDVIIEFSYSFDQLAPPAKLGIFMMLDTYNGQADGSGGAGDKSAVITTNGYFPTDQPGKLFQQPNESIPDFYHVGNFLAIPPVNTVLPIHRLTGTSHNGLPLTTPDILAIGNWRRFRFLSWEVTGTDVGAGNLGDCATIIRWGDLKGSGTVRTAFGMDDKEGNNVFHCRDSKIFVDIKTERVVQQTVVDGAYSPSQFDVEMWVSNTSDAFLTATITFMQPVGAPLASGRLTIDGSTPAVQVIPLPMRGTKKVRWRLNLVPGTTDELLDVPLDFRFQLTGVSGPPRVFKLPCNPIVTIKGMRKPPEPQDTIAPVIQRISSQAKPVPAWSFRTFDRHLGYLWDTGLDRIVVEQNDNANFDFKNTPLVFRRCDTTENVVLDAKVIDTSKAAHIVFAVYDCRGNVSRDSMFYNPRPDIFKPRIERVVATGGNPADPPCNARTYEVFLSDTINQRSDAGDIGFSYGSLSVVGALVNFTSLEINFDRGDVPIRDFDPRASFRLAVVDTMFDAGARVSIVDYAGNADTLNIEYCTLPDIQAPIATPVPTPNPDPRFGPKQWTVTATDVQAWDRGLDSIVVLDSLNVRLSSLGVKPGQPSTSFTVDVITDTSDARLMVEVRDRYYNNTPAGHADTVLLTFSKVPDTLAPNILFTPLPGTNGAIVDVDVNDIHFFGTDKYLYDRGLAVINITARTSNLRLLSLPTFAAGDSQTSFRFEVIDTLSLNRYDTLCLEAVDLYGNRHDSCYIYPLRPDTLAPVIVGVMDAGRTVIVGSVEDSRAYDRGLGSITLENAVNLDPATVNRAGLNGTPGVLMSIGVIDPTKPLSGTLKVRDLIAEIEPTSETEAVHAVSIPFELPAVHLRLDMPISVEGNKEIRASLIATEPFPGRLVDRIAFSVGYAGQALYDHVDGRAATLSATDAGGRIDIVCIPAATADYKAGDLLGEIVFISKGENLVGEFRIVPDVASLVVNDNATTVFSAQKPGDAAISSITLPPPFARLVADSMTYVNGVCDRIISGRRDGAGKVNGLEILGLHPQPSSAGAGSVLQMDLRDLPRDGARAELLGANGEVVASYPLIGDGARVTRVPVKLPNGISSGLYVIRVRAGAEMTQAKVLVVE